LTKETLFEALADINERYVEEAREIPRMPKKRRIWIVAACLTVVLICVPIARYGIALANEDIIIVNENPIVAKLDMSVIISYDGEEGTFERELGISYEEIVGRLPDDYTVSKGVTSYFQDSDGSKRNLNYCAVTVTLPSGKFARVHLGGSVHLSTHVVQSVADKESRIDGAPVKIYQHEMLYNGNIVGIRNEYIAKFEQDGIHYDVRMITESVDELTELISYLVD